MSNYIHIGILTLIFLVPLSLGVFIGITLIKFFVRLIRKKEFKFNFSHLLWEYLWLLMGMSILKITGILGGNFGVSSPVDNYISFDFFNEGFNTATLLNIILFVPFGFLSVVAFKKLSKHWWYGILVGVIFSSLIEFLQMFTGRFAQVDDIVMNTLGTFAGYEIGILFIRIFTSKK